MSIARSCEGIGFSGGCDWEECFRWFGDCPYNKPEAVAKMKAAREAQKRERQREDKHNGWKWEENQTRSYPFGL